MARNSASISRLAITIFRKHQRNTMINLAKISFLRLIGYVNSRAIVLSLYSLIISLDRSAEA
ncbi:hypothetical protein D3C73_1437280 [compost metagenome]